MATKSHRHIDNNGYLTVMSTPVSSFGIFQYSAAQVGLPGDPNRIVNVYRPESEITNPDAVKSFQMVPLIDEHDLLSGFEDDGEEVMSPEEKGVDGVMSNVQYAKPWLVADLKVFTRRMQRAIDSGKVELSLGYTCDWDYQSGAFEGESYEVVQTNLYGNHIALVDAARVAGARVMDSKIVFDCLSFVKPKLKGSDAMINKGKKKRSTAMDNAVQQLKALLPALEQFLTEEEQEPAHQEEGAPPAIPAEEHEGEVMHEGAEENEDPVQDEEVGDLVSQIKILLEKLAAGADTGVDGEEETMDGEEEHAEDENVEETYGENVGDENVEGLEGTAQDCENNGKASQGPASGKNAMGDAALRKSIYADMDKKQKLYNRVSPIIGAFDHALMSSEDVAAYAVKKLKINAPKGAAGVALDSYLTGYERREANKKQASSVGDSAFGDFDPIDQYLANK